MGPLERSILWAEVPIVACSAAISLERDPRPPADAVEESLPALACRNLFGQARRDSGNGQRDEFSLVNKMGTDELSALDGYDEARSAQEELIARRLSLNLHGSP